AQGAAVPADCRRADGEPPLGPVRGPRPEDAVPLPQLAAAALSQALEVPPVPPAGGQEGAAPGLRDARAVVAEHALRAGQAQEVLGGGEAGLCRLALVAGSGGGDEEGAAEEGQQEGGAGVTVHARLLGDGLRSGEGGVPGAQTGRRGGAGPAGGLLG